ncbi:hypothetical protein MKZ38_001506 [Zalerion maritima]|uniref:Uncharacterized protein n=1 Tax=Zalerion maritima TaxID=339359 RepID=A0AAD5RIZ0_9PEZI|nr:hypothetical protein MKZ38_001506 [Zalerion maritima]
MYGLWLHTSHQIDSVQKLILALGISTSLFVKSARLHVGIPFWNSYSKTHQRLLAVLCVSQCPWRSLRTNLSSLEELCEVLHSIASSLFLTLPSRLTLSACDSNTIAGASGPSFRYEGTYLDWLGLPAENPAQIIALVSLFNVINDIGSLTIAPGHIPSPSCGLLSAIIKCRVSLDNNAKATLIGNSTGYHFRFFVTPAQLQHFSRKHVLDVRCIREGALKRLRRTPLLDRQLGIAII